MKKFLTQLILVLMLLPVSTAFAVTVTNLYEAEISVGSQADDLREQAVKDGFLQVLTKLTGDGLITKNPVVKETLRRADYFVQEYSYLLPTPSASEYIIRIHYNQDDIRRLFKRANVAYWGENRPLILVWLAFTNKQKQSEIIGSDSGEDVLRIIKQQGKQLGIPLMFPLLDVFELNQVSPDAVMQVNLPMLKEAAQRYSPDAILIASIDASGDKVDSKWQLIMNNNQWNWGVSDKSIEGVIASSINEVSESLAKRYIVPKQNNMSSTWVRLTITGVMQHNDLSHLTDYLKQLASVQQVLLDQVTGDQVELSILVQGSVASFMQNASVGQHLVLKTQDTQENKLSYQWVH